MRHKLIPLIVEFLGTFILCTVIAICGGYGFNGLLIIGGVLAVIIYGGYHISGAHYNPAVSLAIRLLKKMSTTALIAYWVTQLSAAIVAGLIYQHFFNNTDPTHLPGFEELPIAATEMFGTFALLYVVLNVAASKRTFGNYYYGVVIGLTVVGLAYFLGPHSGAAFNPAVALSQTIKQVQSWEQLWMYFIAAFIGAAIGVKAFLSGSPQDREVFDQSTM